MEWLNNIYQNFEGLLSDLAQLIGIFLLSIWLIGLIFNWKWTYKGNGSYGWNKLLEELGPTTFRFWLGVFITICLLIMIYIYIKV